MNRDSKLGEARKLIDCFARQLLALNEGKEIPLPWKNYLLKAIKPLPGKRGRKHDYEQVAEIVKALAHVGPKLRAERTKQNNRKVLMDKIARDYGISRKTVERIEKDRPEYMSELVQLDSLDPKMREAHLKGFRAKISQEMNAENDAEEKARQTVMQKRQLSSFKPRE